MLPMDPRPARIAGIALLMAAAGLTTARAAEPAGAKSGLPDLATEVAFPNLTFDRPVALAYPDDGSELMFVNEQHQAKVWSFPDDHATADKKLFLQLPDEMNKGNEEGLLGLAFHPKYKQNGEFFVYYSAKDPAPHGRRSVVSRFKVSKADPRKADPKSEERIWVSDDDPYENHNGGTIAFGPDGYLYITLGDSGAADDPLVTGQDPRDWFGSILRIDVDHPSDDKRYGIPADNPAKRDPDAFKNWAPEVYAVGLRNVWKFSFDRATGALWAGDVGQNVWEMVHLIKNGGNYGWSLREANHPFQPNRRQKANPGVKVTPAVAEYKHDVGQSITGGYVYRGRRLPELDGVYVYGDFQSGRIWGLRERDGKAVEGPKELVDLGPGKPKLAIASFAEDPQGELYILSFDGRIHRFARR